MFQSIGKTSFLGDIFIQVFVVSNHSSQSALSIYLAGYPDVVNMASHCSLSAIFPTQSELDCALEEATTQQEKDKLVFQYVKKLDAREELNVPDFQTG